MCTALAAFGHLRSTQYLCQLRNGRLGPISHTRVAVPSAGLRGTVPPPLSLTRRLQMPKFSCDDGSRPCPRAPMFIRDPITRAKIGEKHHHAKVEETIEYTKKPPTACNFRNTYAVKFPGEATPEMRHALLGSALLLNMALYEPGAD